MDNFKDNETDIQHLIISSLEGTASEEVGPAKMAGRIRAAFSSISCIQTRLDTSRMCTALPDRGGLEESRTSFVSPNAGQTLVFMDPDSRICCFGGIDDCCRDSFFWS